MLDIIRRKASSWVTRAIFAVVVLVFIFFFGYNQIVTPNQGPQAVLVRVNGTDIRQNEFNLAYQSTMEQYKQVFKGEIPEGMGKMIVQSTLQQLVNQRLMIDAATQMGLQVSNEELARTIESGKPFQKDGQFDRAAYRDRLAFFQKETGLNYEDLLRNDLLAKKVDDVLKGSVKVSPAEAKAAYWQEKTTFTFEVSKNGTLQKVGPVTLEQRSQVVGADATDADYARIFALTPDRPLLDAPIVVRDTQYSVKLIKKDSPTEDSWKKDEAQFTRDLLQLKQARTTQDWMESLTRKAEIEQITTPNEG